MNRVDLERQLTESFREGGIESPGLEARWLLESRQSAKEIGEIKDEVARRLSGEPLAYILGSKGFHKYEFVVRPGVLIPRPETELLVEVGSKFISENVSAKVIYDFGCGSGCIGLTMLKEFPFLNLYGWDRSHAAVTTSKENAEKLSVSDRSEFFLVDLELFNFSLVPKADLIVANPPYIATGDTRVEPHVLHFEPYEALFSGPTGLELIESWAKLSFANLKAGGMLVMEVGIDQSPFVDRILENLGFLHILWHLDLAGVNRVVSARKDGSYG